MAADRTAVAAQEGEACGLAGLLPAAQLLLDVGPASAPRLGGTQMMVIELDFILSAKRCFLEHLSGANH